MTTGQAAGHPDKDEDHEDGLRHIYSGKVRELYETPGGVLLLVATDRISAYWRR